jgi:hypothetical protein
MPTSSPNSKSASKAALRFRLSKLLPQPTPGKKSRKLKSAVAVQKLARDLVNPKAKNLTATEPIVARAVIVPNAPETVLTEVTVRLALTRAINPPSPKNPPSLRSPNSSPRVTCG